MNFFCCILPVHHAMMYDCHEVLFLCLNQLECKVDFRNTIFSSSSKVRKIILKYGFKANIPYSFLLQLFFGFLRLLKL